MQPSALDAATLEKLISAAVAAPSMHHTQPPWHCRLDPDTVTLEVRAAPGRVPRHAERPDGMARTLNLTVGAAVFNLRVAMAHFGWRPVVQLLPRPSEPELLATVRPEPAPSGGDGHLDDLYEVIWRRHGDRLAFSGRVSGRRLPQRVLTELTEAAHTHGATLYFPRHEETTQLLRINEEAERRNARDRGRATGNGSGPHGQERADAFAQRPTVAVLSTRHDHHADWLRAGQALQHVLLVAAARTARAALLHQALEWPDLRWALSDDRRVTDHAQMLIRLG
ncbi:hypothetical protein ACFV1F_01095 [Streptomyces sp. NPDC059590]|uniref:hypothetical protein n=1 Tax=unclassified Streptomyces TaxID=2593676 RepID=UPI0036C4D8A5